VVVWPSPLEAMVGFMQRLPDPTFWHGKRVLLTGHTGFKGAWLAIWLHQLGAKVQGFALAPESAQSLFDTAGISDLCAHAVGDLRHQESVQQIIWNFKPEIVLHLGAQALVRRSYAQPLSTFATNAMGTAHVLDALRESKSIRSIVVITTDKVYRNDETGAPFTESHALGGHDPYSASKAAAEMVIESYRKSFFAPAGLGVISARAGNVIGGGDRSEDRLIPDALRAWDQGKVLSVRNPNAVRPWQHVVEPLAAYLCAAQALYHAPDLAGAYNFGPTDASAVSVGKVIALAQQVYGQATVDMPVLTSQPHEAHLLRLDVHKAEHVFGIVPVWDVDTAVTKTMRWYRQVGSGQIDAHAACLNDIQDYCAAQVSQ
jgi:CDP-glucose 4,6-dehydratase